MYATARRSREEMAPRIRLPFFRREGGRGVRSAPRPQRQSRLEDLSVSETRRALTIEDLLNVSNVADPHLSPDGDVVAFVVADKYEKAPRSGGQAQAAVAADHYATHRQRPMSRIWQVSARGGDARPLTMGPGTDNNPRW